MQGQDGNEIRLNYVRWRQKLHSSNPLHPHWLLLQIQKDLEHDKKDHPKNWDWWRDKNKEKVLHDTE